MRQRSQDFRKDHANSNQPMDSENYSSLIYPGEVPQRNTAKEQWLGAGGLQHYQSSGQVMRSVKPYKIATYETWEPPDKVLQKTSENQSAETAVITVSTT